MEYLNVSWQMQEVLSIKLVILSVTFPIDQGTDLGQLVSMFE